MSLAMIPCTISSAGSSAMFLQVDVPRPAYRAFRLSGSNEVYRYEEQSSGTKVICKFYGAHTADRDKAARMARQEYEGLAILRGVQPDRIAAPRDPPAGLRP